MLPCLRSRPNQTLAAAVRELPEPRSLVPKKRAKGTIHNRPSQDPELYIRRFRSFQPGAEIPLRRRIAPARRNFAALSRQPELSRTALAFAGAMTHIVRHENSFAIRRTDRRQTAHAHGVEYRTVSSHMPDVLEAKLSSIRPVASSVGYWPATAQHGRQNSTRNGRSNFPRTAFHFLVGSQSPVLCDERIPQGINFSHTRIVVARPYSRLHEYELRARVDDDPLAVHAL